MTTNTTFGIPAHINMTHNGMQPTSIYLGIGIFQELNVEFGDDEPVLTYNYLNNTTNNGDEPSETYKTRLRLLFIHLQHTWFQTELWKRLSVQDGG